MSEGASSQIARSWVCVAAAWVGSMSLVFGTSARVSTLLTDLWCAQEARVAAAIFFARPIPGTTLLVIFGIFAVMYLVVQSILYGRKSVAALTRSVSLIPAIVLLLFVLQLFVGDCGLESIFLRRHGNALIVGLCIFSTFALTVFALCIVPKDFGIFEGCERMMVASLMIADAGIFMVSIQLIAVILFGVWGRNG